MVQDIALSEDCSLMRQNLWLQKIKKGRREGEWQCSEEKSSTNNYYFHCKSFTATCARGFPPKLLEGLRTISLHFILLFLSFRALTRGLKSMFSSQSIVAYIKAEPPPAGMPQMLNNCCFYTVFLFSVFKGLFFLIPSRQKPFRGTDISGSFYTYKETLYQNVQRCLVGDFSVVCHSKIPNAHLQQAAPVSF